MVLAFSGVHWMRLGQKGSRENQSMSATMMRRCNFLALASSINSLDATGRRQDSFQVETEDSSMMLHWDDLAEDEKVALRRMNRGPYPELSQEMAERLIAL